MQCKNIYQQQGSEYNGPGVHRVMGGKRNVNVTPRYIYIEMVIGACRKIYLIFRRDEIKKNEIASPLLYNIVIYLAALELSFRDLTEQRK